MTELLPSTAVVRVCSATFDPSRFAEVDAVNTTVSIYLIPAVDALPGLLYYYTGVAPTGSMVHVSVWDTEAHAAQLDRLLELTVDARADLEAAGATFAPIVDYPISWIL